MICESCEKNFARAKHNPLQRIISPFNYEGKITELITQLKFHQKLIVAPVLANYLIHQIENTENITLPEAIIPVPLHHQRLKERGFNQSLEIAKPISRHFQIPIDNHLCYRSRLTLPQTKLTAYQRKENVKKAFVLKHSPNYQHVVIIDDVVTTGATVNQMIYLLEKHGVKRVDVWCCARA